MLSDKQANTPVAGYEFVFQAEREIKLSPFPARVFHGAFGNALKNDDVCVMPDVPDTECVGCGKRNDCDYTLLFKNYRDPPPQLKKKQDFPASVIFRLGTQQSYVSTPDKHHLSIHLHLVGEANTHLPRVIDTMYRLGLNGIRDKRLMLTEVYQHLTGGLPHVIWLNGELKTPLPAQVLPLPAMPEKIMIRFLTPYQPGGSARNQPFDIRYYLRSIVQRHALLQDLYTDQMNTFVNFTDLRAVADSAQLSQAELYWYEQKGPASRSNAGVLGYVILPMTGLELIWPWLYRGQFFNIGSRSGFGMGQYELVGCN